MFLAFLRWLFKINGHAPSKKSDKVFAAAACCLFLASAISSFPFLKMEAIDPVYAAGLKVHVVLITLGSFGTLINANVREVNFELIINTVANSYESDWKEILSFVVYYATGCYIKLVPFLRGRQNIWNTFIRIYNFHIISLPVIQLMLLCRVLQKLFRSLNNQMKLATSNTNCDPPSCSLVSSMFKKHNDLRKTISDINTYFLAFSLFFMSFSVNRIIGIFYKALKGVEHGGFKVDGSIAPPISLLVGLLFFCDQAASEANKTVSLAHELITQNSSLELLRLVEMFSLSHVNNPVSISVAGVFDLNMALLTKMIAFSLAYFVVILQLNIA